MKKICSLILIVIAIISTTIYQYYYHDGSPNNIVIMDESHELVDTSIKETVSSRILAVYLDEPYYYYLGYDGIGRYDIRNHMLDVLEFEIYGAPGINKNIKVIFKNKVIGFGKTPKRIKTTTIELSAKEKGEILILSEEPLTQIKTDSRNFGIQLREIKLYIE